MTDDTLFEDEFDGADANDDIFQPGIDPVVEPAYEPVNSLPERIVITMDVPSVLKELMYHFKASDLELLSRSLAEIIPVYGKLGLLKENTPPWTDQIEEKPKKNPKPSEPKPARALPYRFTEEEITNFVALADSGVSFEEIAKNSGRSVLGVKRAVQRRRERSVSRIEE